MKALKYAPKEYIGSDEESIASVINIGYLLLPLFLTIVLIRQIIQGDTDITIVVAISLIFSFFIRQQFLQGQLRKSVISVVIFFNLLLTITCTLGNGINDIGIIGYPIIVGFSGIILDQRKLAIASALSIVGVTWLVAGEQFGVYQPVPVPTGNAGDLIVSSMLVLIGSFVAFSLTNNLKRSLKSAQQEILISKQDAGILEKETKEKLEIIDELHRAVINSLGHIQQLIAHRQNKPTNINPIYTSLKRKVLVIEVAHNILLSHQTPIMLDIRELTSELLTAFEKNLKTSMLHMDVGNDSLSIPLDLAINYGICLLELINEVDHETNDSLSVVLQIDDGEIILTLSGFSVDAQKESGIVIELLTKQLKGELTKRPSEIKLLFKPAPKR